MAVVACVGNAASPIETLSVARSIAVAPPFADVLGHGCRGRKRRLRQQQHEFIAAIPGYRVGLPSQNLPTDRHHLAQNRVADLMTEAVIDLLEAVDIDQAQRQRPACPR